MKTPANCPECGSSCCYVEHPITVSKPGEDPVEKLLYVCSGGCKKSHNKEAKRKADRVNEVRFWREV